jgi:hypothetical protein
MLGKTVKFNQRRLGLQGGKVVENTLCVRSA